MQTKGQIAVVDDDPELRSLLHRYLSENGYSVRSASNAASLDNLLERGPVDLIILDLGLPGEDGMAICRRLRFQGNQTPIIILTARGDPVDRVIGLETGADDYINKPFMPRELLARINGIFRRQDMVQNAGTQAISFGPYRLDLQAMVLSKAGIAVDLSSREFAVLRALALNPGRALSRAQLIGLAVGRDARITDRSIDVLINRVRVMIEADPKDPVYVKTVWGKGYVLAI